MLGVWDRRGFKAYWKEVIELYDDLYFSKQIQNWTDRGRRLPHQQGEIGIDFVASYDGDNITFYYLIQAMPRKLLIDFKDNIRRQCRQGVRVNFLNLIRGHQIEWESVQMRSRLRVLHQVGEENDSKGVNAYNLHQNLSSIGKQSWVEDSLSYLAVADRERNRSLLKSSMLMTISGKRGENFDDSVKLIEDYTRNIGIQLNRVLYDIPEVLRYFSPFSRVPSKGINGIIPTQVLTDEILARYTVYNQGTLGVSGLYFGTDVYSRFPVLKRVKPKDDTAENWLVTAETGGGKSHGIKSIILQLLADNYNGTIMDIEGFEYIPIANFMSHKSKVVVLNMAEGSGKYFDPVEIFDKTGIPDIDASAKNLSLNFTLAIYKTLLGRAYDEDTWFDTVINDAVSETYSEAGVTDDPNTWERSKGLTLFRVYDKLKELRVKEHRKDAEYLSRLDKTIAIVSKYFESDGTRSSVFAERVSVSDIIDADLLVCSFGMAGKSPQSVDEVQLALMQLGAAQLSHQRSIFSKSQGKYNFKIWEEFQRWGKFPGSENTIGVAVTGGRKLGDVNIIITNAVGQILRDDRFDIFGNTTSFLIGAIGDKDVRTDLCNRLSIPEMIPELDRIAAAAKTDDEHESLTVSPLTYSFLCGLDRSKFGIIKTELPESLATSDLFKTGVDLQDWE